MTQEAAATIETVVLPDAGPDRPEEETVTADLDQDHVHHHVVTVKEATEMNADPMTVETAGVTLTVVKTETTDTAAIAMTPEADVATAHRRSVALLATVAEADPIRRNASVETAEKSSLKSTCRTMPPNNAGKTQNKATAPPPTTPSKEETELQRFDVP